MTDYIFRAPYDTPESRACRPPQPHTDDPEGNLVNVFSRPGGPS